MIFNETDLPGAFIIELEPRSDDRGFFARTYCQREFKAHGLNTSVVQCNLSFNKRKGTLRGLHFQIKPAEEAKLVRCAQGSIYDVIVDLRKESATYCKWIGVELSANSEKMLYVPEGFAHGYLTLEDDTSVSYQVSQFYQPSLSRVIKWDDPTFKIVWPITTEMNISVQDSEAGYFEQAL